MTHKEKIKETFDSFVWTNKVESLLRCRCCCFSKWSLQQTLISMRKMRADIIASSNSPIYMYKQIKKIDIKSCYVWGQEAKTYKKIFVLQNVSFSEWKEKCLIQSLTWNQCSLLCPPNLLWSIYSDLKLALTWLYDLEVSWM